MSCSIIRNKDTNKIERVLAPNGEDSILFRDVLSVLSKEPEQALRVWAYAYTSHFANEHGDWQNGARLQLDTNGEPVASYLLEDASFILDEEELVDVNDPRHLTNTLEQYLKDPKMFPPSPIWDALRARTDLAHIFNTKVIQHHNELGYDADGAHIVNLRSSPTISITKDPSQAISHVVQHEVIHTVALSALRTKTPTKWEENLRNVLYRTYYTAFDNATEKERLEYGFTDIDEFLAEVISNPDFKLLVERLVPNSTGRLEESFVNYIKNKSAKILVSRGAQTATPIPYFAISTEANDMKKANSKRIIRNADKSGYTMDGVPLRSVSDTLVDMSTRVPISKDSTIGTDMAARIFKDVIPGTSILTDMSDKPVTQEQYAQLYDQRMAKGQIKGTATHAIFQQFFHPEEMSDEQITSIMEQGGYVPAQFDWVRENIERIGFYKLDSDYFKRIKIEDGYRYAVNKDRNDDIAMEVPIASAELGIAGIMDILIAHGGDLYSIYDLKTGTSFNKLFQSHLFKYGDTATEDIFDNARNRAKAQIMMYAIMMKITNPKARFKTLKPLLLKNKSSMYEGDHQMEINIHAYLHMIESYLKAEKPDQYKALMALPHAAEIFNPNTYSTVTKDILGTYTEDPAQALKIKSLKLQSLLLEKENITGKIKSGDSDAQYIKRQVEQTLQEIIDLKKNKNMSFAAANDADISWMESYLGSPSSSTNPYISIYYELLNKQKNKAEKEFVEWKRTYDALLEGVIKANPSAKNFLGTATKSLLGGINRKELFKFAYKKERTGDGDFTTRYVTETDAEWGSLTPVQKRFMTHVLNGMEQFFVDEKSSYVDPKTGKTVAIANKVMTTREVFGKERDITNLDLFNGVGSSDGRSNRFVYKRGFIPKVAPKMSDIIEKYGYFTKEMRKFLYNKYLTFYFESAYDSHVTPEEVIPLKYLGTEEIIREEAYTFDLDHAVNTFMRDYFYKTHLDEVYSFGTAMKIYLMAKEDANKDVSYEKIVEWFEDSVQMHVLGRRNTKLKMTKRDVRLNSSKGWMKFNWIKAFRTMKSFFAGPVMWLKPISGMANFTFGILSAYKEGLKNSISKRTFADGRTLDFTAGDLTFGIAQATKMLGEDAMSGAVKSNKLYQLMDRFRMFNNSYDWYVEQNKLLTTNNKLFSTKSMYFFQTAPEEFLSAAIFAAQLKALKHNGKSLWDMYVEVPSTDANGNKYTLHQWDGTVRGVRPTTNVDNGTQYEDITELTDEEVAAMKYGYEVLQGGYKHDERVRAEYYIFGELMLQFKKYLPSIMRNIMASKGQRMTQGFYKKVGEVDGKDILEWTPDVIEGRFRVLAGAALTWLGYRWDTPNNRLKEFFNLQSSESYKWENLSVRQKDAILDAGITMLTWLLFTTGAGLMWDRDEEKKSMYKIYNRIQRDVTGQWNLAELSKNMLQLGDPVVARKTIKMIQSSADLGASVMFWAAGMDEESFTKQGNLRGWKEFQRNWHFLSSYHDIMTFLEGDEELAKYFDIRLK